MLDHTMRVQMQLDSLSTTDFVDVISRFCSNFSSYSKQKLETAAKCEI